MMNRRLFVVTTVFFLFFLINLALVQSLSERSLRLLLRDDDDDDEGDVTASLFGPLYNWWRRTRGDIEARYEAFKCGIDRLPPDALLRFTSCACDEESLRYLISARTDRNRRGLVRLCLGADVRVGSEIDVTGKDLGVACWSDDDACVLRGDDGSRNRLFVGAPLFLSLSGVTVQNFSSEESGGALSMAGPGEIVAVRCTFRNNRAAADGGAIHYYAAGGTTTGTAVLGLGFNRFEGNAAGATGGAVRVAAGGADVTSLADVFVDNAAGVAGGAMAVTDSQVKIDESVFKSNSAGTIGGDDIYITDDNDPAAGGSFVECDEDKVIFCDGTAAGIEEAGAAGGSGMLQQVFNNTNCDTVGMIGGSTEECNV